MSKLLTLEEANDIVSALCKEYGVDLIVLKQKWNESYDRNYIVVYQRVLKRGKLWKQYSNRDVFTYDPENLEHAVVKIKEYLSCFDKQVELAEHIRREYADYLLNEELKKE